MKIGFLGAGTVAQSIAREALKVGHEVLLSGSREPAALADVIEKLGPAASAVPSGVAASQPMVVLAVPWLQVESVLKNLPPWSGRILVDATNPFIEFSPKLVLADLGDLGSSEIVQLNAPDARVVKAFNSIQMVHFNAGANVGDARRVLFVSGDAPDAKEKVTSLVESFGFATVDLGSLRRGGKIQQAGGQVAGKDFQIAA